MRLLLSSVVKYNSTTITYFYEARENLITQNVVNTLCVRSLWF